MEEGNEAEDEDGNLFRVIKDSSGEMAWELILKAEEGSEKQDGQEKPSEEKLESSLPENGEESGIDKEGDETEFAKDMAETCAAMDKAEQEQQDQQEKTEDDKSLGQINYEWIQGKESCHWNDLHPETKAIYTRGAAHVARVIKQRELKRRKTPGQIFYEACAAETMRNNPDHICPPYEAMSKDEQLACEAGAIAVQRDSVQNLKLNITGNIGGGE